MTLIVLSLQSSLSTSLYELAVNVGDKIEENGVLLDDPDQFAAVAYSSFVIGTDLGVERVQRCRTIGEGEVYVVCIVHPPPALQRSAWLPWQSTLST